MSAHKGCFICLLFFININGCFSFGRTNFHITRFEQCDSRVKYPITFNITFRTVGNKQYVDGLFTATIPLDSNLRSNFTIEVVTGNSLVYLFSITEKDACKGMHKYMGEFIYDLERNAQLIPGMCPIPQGRYHVHNTPLNFDKITLQTFPFGKLRFTEMMLDKQNKICTCYIAEVNNRAS